MRLSRILRNPEDPSGESLSLRSIVTWTLVAAAVVLGVVLYFRYERMLTPLVS